MRDRDRAPKCAENGHLLQFPGHGSVACYALEMTHIASPLARALPRDWAAQEHKLGIT
jgi:hypothetical protein